MVIIDYTSGELQNFSNRRKDLERRNLNARSYQRICLLNVEGGERKTKEVGNSY